MRKLKLQVQMTIDGFVAGRGGELDWMTFEMDDKAKKYVTDLTDSSDTILLGRKMTDGFVNYWTSVLDNPESDQYSFAQKMVNTPKIVFSKTVTESRWANTTVTNGDLVEEIEKLKQQDGQDIIVYGGANFVSNLIEKKLIDEFHIVINPAAIGRGLTIFGNLKNTLKLKFVQSTAFSNGKVANHYKLDNTL